MGVKTTEKASKLGSFVLIDNPSRKMILFAFHKTQLTGH